jgi:hypothetical protein
LSKGCRKRTSAVPLGKHANLLPDRSDPQFLCFLKWKQKQPLLSVPDKVIIQKCGQICKRELKERSDFSKNQAEERPKHSKTTDIRNILLTFPEKKI